MKKSGRRPLPEHKKVKIMTAYLTGSEQKLIKKKYGNLTKATRERVLTECA